MVWKNWIQSLSGNSESNSSKPSVYLAVMDIHSDYVLYFLEPATYNSQGKPVISQTLCILSYSKGKINKLNDCGLRITDCSGCKFAIRNS